jgi:PAS domain S-box-containing protein
MGHPEDLLNLFKEVDLDKVLDVFTRSTGVAAIITHIDGTPITEPYNFTTFCQNYCRCTEQGRRKCHESDRYGGRESARTRMPFIYNCLNSGLIDCAAPVIVEDHHIATILCGQALEEPLDKNLAVERARSIGILDTEGYLGALDNVPLMSRSRLLDIANLMAVITQTISEVLLGKYRLFRSSQEYLNNLINSVSDCIISTDNDHTITMVNNASTRIFGYGIDELIGKSILTLFSDDNSKKIYKEKVNPNSNNFDWRSELTAKKSDDSTFPIQISLSGITNSKNHENKGYAAVIRDVSEEKKIQHMKEGLIGMVTHDMRNPVLSIQKALQVLAGSNPDLEESQTEILSMALATTHQLFGMANDSLDSYRSESGQFTLNKSRIDLKCIIQESINQLSYFAKDRMIDIHFNGSPGPLKLSGDQIRLTRAFVNLLDNAIKYSSIKSEITITSVLNNGENIEELKGSIPLKYTQFMEAGKQYILTEITDHGLGIPGKYHELVFDKFFKVKSRDHQGRKSIGLGLTVCKQIINAHDGWIWMNSPVLREKSGENKGCRFSFLLPVDKCDAL